MDMKLIRFGLLGAVFGAGIHFLLRTLRDEEEEDDRPPIIVSNGSVRISLKDPDPQKGALVPKATGNKKAFRHDCGSRKVSKFDVTFRNLPSSGGSIRNIDEVEIVAGDESATISIVNDELIVNLTSDASANTASEIVMAGTAERALFRKNGQPKGSFIFVDSCAFVEIRQRK